MPLGKEHDYSWISDEKKAEWTAEGHWPLPPGIVLVQEKKPDPQVIAQMTKNLLNVLSPKNRKIVEKALNPQS